jgi:hypothetical protein
MIRPGLPLNVLVLELIEGQKFPFRFSAGAVPQDLGNVVHLKIHGPGAVRHDMVFRRGRAEMDAVGPFGEEIHRRRAEQVKMRNSGGVRQSGNAAIEKNNQVKLIVLTAPQCPPQVSQFNKQETLRHGKIFLQQTVALIRAVIAGQQSLIIVKARRQN